MKSSNALASSSDSSERFLPKARAARSFGTFAKSSVRS